MGCKRDSESNMAGVKAIDICGAYLRNFLGLGACISLILTIQLPLEDGVLSLYNVDEESQA